MPFFSLQSNPSIPPYSTISHISVTFKLQLKLNRGFPYPTTFLLMSTDTIHSKLPSPYQILPSSDLDLDLDDGHRGRGG